MDIQIGDLTVVPPSILSNALLSDRSIGSASVRSRTRSLREVHPMNFRLIPAVIAVGLSLSCAASALGQPAPTPLAVKIDLQPLLEITDPEVPVGTCQVEVDCPGPVAFGEEITCEITVLQKIQDEDGNIDFQERKIPPRIWRKNGKRAFAWQVDVSKVLPGGHCLLSRNEEPFTLNNRFRLTPDFCPGSLFIGARPVRFFPPQQNQTLPYACELPDGATQPVCNLLRNLDARTSDEQLAEELGCTGELLIKSCKLEIECPPPTPPIIVPTPTPTPTQTAGPPTVTPPTPTPTRTPGVPTPTPTPTAPPTPGIPTPTATPPPPTPTPTPTPPPPTPTPTQPPPPTPTLPIVQDPARIIPRSNGLHAVEMHGRIEVPIEEFDPNLAGLTWKLLINGSELVQFVVPAGGFNELRGGDFVHQNSGTRVSGGLEFFNFHTTTRGGQLWKAVRMKGYTTALEAVVGLPSNVNAVPAQIILIIPGWGTFSTTGVMARGGGGIWHMTFPPGGSIGELP
jgi:hypothetical protein